MFYRHWNIIYNCSVPSVGVWNKLHNLIVSMEISKELIKFIEDIREFDECTKELILPILFTFKECMTILSEPNLIEDDIYLFKIGVVLDYLHDELNTGHWSKVSVSTRQAFTVSTFIKIIILLNLKKENKEDLPEILKCVDLGLLLGAPLEKNSELLLNTASYLTNIINKSESNEALIETLKKRRYSFTENSTEYEKILGKEINILSCPSIELFNREYFIPEIPVKLTECINHWPAMIKWLDITYLLKVAGSRTVPVEIGSNYADENWGQKLMTMEEFIKNHFLSDTSAESLGYLAQHNLFDQITELRNDIFIPDYCSLSKNENDACEPDINAWFGPQRTVSPLHFDPKNNLLTQVFGTKQIILFAPNDSEYLYPHEDILLQNTSQVNPLNPNLEDFPLFKKATIYKCLLKPGEMLYIPPKWWHHITALDKSFSVSFWWQ